MERLREPESKVFNCDCVDYMRSLPDNYFDLIIADPPYGGGNDEQLGGGKKSIPQRRSIREVSPTNRFSGGTWATIQPGRSSEVEYYTTAGVF